MREIKSAIHASYVWATGFFHGQPVDWQDAYDRRMWFYEVFGEEER